MSKLHEALAKFQAGNPVAKFDKEGQSGASRKYGYASYLSVIHCLKPLAEAGVSWSHAVESEPAGDGTLNLKVTTTLALGEERMGSVIAYPMPPNIQSAGSTITYLKRYQLVALAGLAADEDDDGQTAQDDQQGAVAATRTRSKAVTAPKPPIQQTPPTTVEQATKSSQPYEAAMAQIKKAETPAMRQDLLVRITHRLAEKVFTPEEYCGLIRTLLGKTNDQQEILNVFKPCVIEANTNKQLPDKEMSIALTGISLRVQQIENMRPIGGTVKKE